MKSIEVCSAVIIKNDKIFVTQRGYGDFKDRWEFPGGKLEEGESPEDCIIREIKEELDADIKVVKYLNTVEYTYPSFHLKMHNYICELRNSHVSLLEHEAAKFVEVSELDFIDFLPADILVLEDVKKAIESHQ